MKAKGNMYEFVETWNPLAGACFHNCKYCSTNNLKKRFPNMVTKYSGEPRIDEKQINKNLGKGKTIFVCGQNDLFANGVKSNEIIDILNICHKYPDNTYFFQTKNPYKILMYQDLIPENSIICTTLETNRWYDQMGKAPQISKRVAAIYELSFLFKTQITIEPIMDFDLNEFVEIINKIEPYQVNIGADSKNNNLPEPSKEKVLQLIEELEKFTKVHLKSNLNRLIK